MAQAAIHIFAFAAILVVGWVLFVLWVIGVILRALWSAFAGIFGIKRHPAARQVEYRHCTRLRCGEQNPVGANFCRRCGAPMNQASKNLKLQVSLGGQLRTSPTVQEAQ